MFRRLLAAALLAFSLTGCKSLDEIADASEARFHAGYHQGTVAAGRFVAASASVGGACNINKLYNSSKDYGELEIGVRTVHQAILSPQPGYFAGATPFFTYTYPLSDDAGIYLEGGAGPGYLSIPTREQGDPGFNFIDQAGAGILYHLDDHLSIQAGYGFTHISHARLRDGPNKGIDLHSIIIGLKLRF